MAASTLDRGTSASAPGAVRTQTRKRAAGHQLPIGAISLASSAVGMGALVVVVQGRATDADSLPPTLSMALLAVSIAGLVLGGLAGILALARPGGSGQHTSGVAAAGVLVSVWFMALGLEVLALLSSSANTDTLDRTDPSSPGVAVMGVFVLLAAAAVTVQVVRHLHRARTGRR